ncbi:Mitochondrial substrate carrier family protein b, partial [Thalictrum thalictroides]
LVQLIPRLESQRDNANADFCVRLLAGGLAGVTSASATYTLDLVRTRHAAQTNVIYYRGIAHALRTICRDEGFLGLYKGLGANLLGVGPNIAISFSVYEILRTSWQLRRFPIVEPDAGHTKLRLSREGLEAIERITTPIAAVAVSHIPILFFLFVSEKLKF